jgi:hypothetical protein
VQQAYLKASNTDAGDEFGHSVSVSGETVVIGAPYEDSSATGVNGNQANNNRANSGAAYVFVRRAGTWTQRAYLKASNPGSWDLFGSSVSISGNTVLVGAFGEDSGARGVNGNQADNSALNAGAAYVFVHSGNTWTQQAYLKASNTDGDDWFGWSVSVSGETMVIAACAEDSNATGVNGDQTNNSASRAGAAYVFVRRAGTWTQQAYLKASNTDQYDEFGRSVSISGDTVVVGAYYEKSNATGVNGDQTNNSASRAGAAYVFVRRAGTWTQQAYLKASNTGHRDKFGLPVSISGDTVVVGAYGEASNARGVNGDQSNNSAYHAGAAYVFVRSGSTWSQEAYLKASNTDAGDEFCFAVAVSGDTVVVGAHLEDSAARGVNGNQADNSLPAAGAAYVFVRSGSTWSQDYYLKASNTDAGDGFGIAVSISGGTVVIGADGEASNARGVNGNQKDNGAVDSGAAYVFEPDPPSTFTTFGLGCKGSKTGVPALSNRQLPALGKSFMLDLANAPLATGGLLFFGFAPASLDLGPIGAPGCTVHAQLPFLSWTVYTDWFGKWPNPTRFPLPNDHSLVGAVFYNQVILLDQAANQLGLIVSNGGKATIGY